MNFFVFLLFIWMTSTVKKRKRRSEAWNFFYEGEGAAECKLCGRVFSNPSTSTLMRHREKKHPNDDEMM